MAIERIYFNEEKWKSCLDVLTSFYFDILIADIRFGQHSLK